uniref:Ribonuclease Z n=1 Tax=Gracilariopsis longissima TaxID=172976 RepID=A0A345U9A9_9FLOR|nr:ribonuclease Z [Gracilariopsis longissima]AXI97045.1 ribonuclease Z [Gracilariopsis longissima]UAD88961.1 ribonuclease Z [Gracilariopsis longissima]
MNIIHLNSNDLLVKNTNICFYWQLKHLKKIWLFNCFEGCQHYLAKKHIKISQVSIIIITEMNIYNVSGLPGLLSSLSLTNKQDALHIYGPDNLAKYVELTKKYSQTHFRYNLYFHKLKTGCIIQNNKYQIYCFKKMFQFEFIINIGEKNGKFKLDKAQKLKIKIGPLYGQLKRGSNFILPDGTLINSKNLRTTNYSGNQISFLLRNYMSKQDQQVYYKNPVIKLQI